MHLCFFMSSCPAQVLRRFLQVSANLSFFVVKMWLLGKGCDPALGKHTVAYSDATTIRKGEIIKARHWLLPGSTQACLAEFPLLLCSATATTSFGFTQPLETPFYIPPTQFLSAHLDSDTHSHGDQAHGRNRRREESEVTC